jgi:hypothetical protein
MALASTRLKVRQAPHHNAMATLEEWHEDFLKTGYLMG